MPTVADVARSAIAAVNSSVGVVLVSQWVSERYSQFIRRGALRHMRTVRELSIPAPVNTGTVTVTSGSDTVTGDATAAAVWTQDLVGRYFRISTVWYEITSISNTTLRLKSPYTEDTGAALAYTVIQRFHPLPDDVRWATSFRHLRFNRTLRQVNPEELDIADPARRLVGTPPIYIIEGPRAVNGAKTIEIYPYPEGTETLHYVAWAIPPKLTHNDNIPSDIDTEMLKEGVMIDVYRWESATAARAGQAEIAALMRNEARAQYTQWHSRDLPEAAAAERAMDDVQFILETVTSGRHSGRDITDARGQVWSGNS